MKHSVIAGSLLALLGTQGALAQSSVTIGGILDVGLDHAKSGPTSITREVSGGGIGSRIVFRGAEDLGGGLRAQFHLEMGINVDAGSIAQGGLAFGRESSVGLSSTQWGTVTMGRLPTPYFVTMLAGDGFQFMGSGGYFAVARNEAAGQRQLFPIALTARADNAIGYVSPNMNGFEVRALYALGEGATALGRQQSLSLRYRNKDLDLVASGSVAHSGSGGNGKLDSRYVGGSYDFGAFRAYAGYISEKNTCRSCAGVQAQTAGVAVGQASAFSLTNVGVRVPVGASTTLMAQVARVSDRSGYAVNPGSRDATWVGIGAEYAMSRRTQFYTSVATIDNKNGSRYVLGTGVAFLPATLLGAADSRSTTYNVGVRHSF